MSVIEEKKALRTFIRKKERTLDPTYKAESSEAICRHLLALDEYKSAKIVFAFAGTEKEIDTSLFMNETIAAGKTLILPRCAAEHARKRVCRRHAEIVVAMHGKVRPVAVFHVCAQVFNQRAHFARRSVANGIRDVHGGGAVSDGGLHNLGQEGRIAARGILCGKFDVRAVFLRVGHHGRRLFEHLFGLHAQLIFHVQR